VLAGGQKPRKSLPSLALLCYAVAHAASYGTAAGRGEVSLPRDSQAQ